MLKTVVMKCGWSYFGCSFISAMTSIEDLLRRGKNSDALRRFSTKLTGG